MSVAIPIPLLQHLPDVNVTPAVGVDEYALVYDHDTARFVLRAPFDGTPYALLAGRAGGQTLYGGTAANEDITIHGTSNATRTTSYVLLQPTAGYVGIGTSAPEYPLDIVNASSGRFALNLRSSSSEIRPGMRIEALRPDTEGIAFDFFNAVIGKVGYAKTQIGAFGAYGRVDNSSNAYYLYMDARFNGAWNNATLKIDAENRVGIALAGDARPETALHVVGAATVTGGIRPAADSTTALQLQNASGTSVLNVDTTNGRVGIGTTAPANSVLHVIGATAGVARLDGSDNNTSTIAGTAARIMFVNTDNTVGNRGALEFWNGAINKMYGTLGVIYATRTSGSETGDYYFSLVNLGTVQEIMRIKGSGLVGIGTTSPATALHVVGAATITAGIRPAADSTTALQLQNAAGTSILNVDTTNSRVGIGTTTLDSLLTLSVLANGSQRGLKIVSGGASQYVNILDVFAVGPTTRPLFSVLPSGGISVFRYESTENDVRESIVLGRFYNGPGGVGMGNSIVFKSPDDNGVGTGTSRSQARVYSAWNVSATATRKADLVLTAYDTAEREGLRIRGNGSAPAIGFLGAEPQARIAHVADPAGGATVDAEARSVINSILTTLENFGFHATS